MLQELCSSKSTPGEGKSSDVRTNTLFSSSGTKWFNFIVVSYNISMAICI